MAVHAAEPAVPEGYVSIYNGKGFENWMLLSKDGKPETAIQVFSPGENGEIHVYQNFQDGFQLDQKIDDTHAMMVSKKSYSRYSLKFEYKWGPKRLNNFGQWQYDAGLYYHMIDQKIWPAGLEFQIRYEHLNQTNYTGELWDLGVSFTWEQCPDGCFILPGKGGTVLTNKKWDHPAAADAVVHGLVGQWNQCELIVMGGHYTIHKVNGKVVNHATALSKDTGPIAFQAETAEIFYRNIRIKEFQADLPAEPFLKSDP